MDDLNKALEDIQALISKSELEQAYTRLVQLLESSDEYAELADIARVNQADLYTWKAQELIGRLSGDESRRTQSQLADNALKIVRQLKTGKLYFEPEIKPHSSKAWRYYVTGGIGALVLAAGAWYFFSQQECPDFGDDFETRVMILPILDAQKENPADDIMDELTKWIEQTPGLEHKTSVAVHRRYDIQNEYPNSTQAVEIAKKCEAQMLVWGKKRTLPNNNYILDVRYRLLKAGNVIAAGDTMINKLLSVTEEASVTSDAKAIGRVLYMALANYKRATFAANFIKSTEKSMAPAGVAGDTMAYAPVDTMLRLAFADNFIVQKEPEKAIEQYDKVLEQYPDNVTARTKRGALFLQQGMFEESLSDLEAVHAEATASAPALRDTRIALYLKTNQPVKARKELANAQKEGSFDSVYIADTRKRIEDSTAALERRRDKLERAPKTTTNVLQSAKANIGLGETSKATTQANVVLKKQPTNTEAVRIVVEAQLQKGDTATAKKILRTAEKAGVDPKSIRLSPLKKLLQSSSGQ